MPNEVIQKEFYEIISKDDIEFLKKFDEYKKRAKVIEDQIKKLEKDFLERNGLTEEGYEQDGVRFDYKKGYTKKVLDADALKEQGIYEDFLKEVKVSPTATITIVYEE